MRRGHRRAHHALSWILAAALAAIVVAATALRQDPSRAPAPALLEAPLAAAPTEASQ